ncbi:hypothetical protein [Clostridium butyricum]|uniref:ORFA polypeptide n=1 Tax=Clostridium butyricum TaxID=1492 RepID=Q45963_CLOBU|nr:hypothetical protein [Clostridium butyricum]MBZ5748634.1 hypothetical protein [Clostridium butyricum]QMW93448.1 hypothetical protein FF104_21290 [Clostridium butyricum]CAA44563.1 ORFA polypeptide [Clostridium butyricum]BBK79236.1 hypothetical protein Cbu04g_42440 [Clostridium butyricum]GEQ27710.1 hypothetical protein CBU03nite_41330 [Clostridium butyricum]
MKQDALITGVKKYNFKNNDGENVKGAKISYLIDESDTDGENITGYLPRQASIKDMSLISGLVELPGVYEINFKTVSGANNKEELKIIGIDFQKSCDFKNVFVG